MPRTTTTAVRQVISTTLTEPQVNAFIQDANVWVTDELSAAGLSDARLEVIERYLACAFIRMRDLGLKSTTIEDVSESYQVDSETTDYLLRAAGMDPTGKVKKQFMPTGDRIPVQFVVGTTFVEERKSVEEDA